MSGQWMCRRMGRGEMNQDPVHEEFFKQREDLVEALVRESVQNSLDASINGRVTVRFGFSTGPLEPQAGRQFVGGVEPHVRAALGGAPTHGAIDFLTIEDFGTRGLCGVPEMEMDDPGQLTKNDFYYFWRNVGRSKKSDTDRGRWGLGKIVYPATSTLFTFFGMTVRKDDGRKLLMGQAVLKVHELQGKRHCPYPYYGVPAGEDFCLPVEDVDAIADFTRTFELERRDQPGLSIVIPSFRKDEVTPEGILRAAVRNYFYPILAGALSVEVRDRGRVVELTALTIRQVASQLHLQNGNGQGRPQFDPLFDLAAWAIGLDEARYISLIPITGGAPGWDPGLFAAVNLSDTRERFEAGERLAFRVPVKVEQKGRAPSTSWFKVFIAKAPDLSKGEEHYIRQGITIADIRRVRDAQVRGLVVIDDDALSALLGDAEGPAHADWSERETRLKERYVHGPSCVRFVKNSLKELVATVSRPPEGLNEKLLESTFFVDVPAEGAEGHQVVRKGAGETEPEGPPEPPIPPGQPSPIKVGRIEGGFKIAGRPGFRGAIIAEVAYEVRRGNPFKRYDINDFDLDRKPIVIDHASVEISRRNGNTLEFAVVGDDFEVKVTGFDANRDLVVRARAVAPEDGASGEAA